MSQYSPTIRPFRDLQDAYNNIKEMDRHIKMEFMKLGKSGIEGSQIIVHTSTGTTSPAPSTVIDYRAGSQSVTDGTNTITFVDIKSSSYVIDWVLLDSDGIISSATPVMSSRTPTSFQITCLGAGTLYYKVMLTK